MSLSKQFMKSLDVVLVPSHKGLAIKLTKYAVTSRTRISYMGEEKRTPNFAILESHFERAIPTRFHDHLEQIIKEMGVYLAEAGYTTTANYACPMYLSQKGIDLGEEKFWERHPVWFGAIVVALIGCVSGIIQAFAINYFGLNR